MICHWFNSNKLSLNANKTNFTLFHKVRQRDNIPLVSPTLKISNILVKRVDHIKFLVVFFFLQKSNFEKSYKSNSDHNIKKPRHLKSSQTFVKPEI